MDAQTRSPDVIGNLFVESYIGRGEAVSPKLCNCITALCRRHPYTNNSAALRSGLRIICSFMLLLLSRLLISTAIVRVSCFIQIHLERRDSGKLSRQAACGHALYNGITIAAKCCAQTQTIRSLQNGFWIAGIPRLQAFPDCKDTVSR